MVIVDYNQNKTDQIPESLFLNYANTTVNQYPFKVIKLGRSNIDLSKYNKETTYITANLPGRYHSNYHDEISQAVNSNSVGKFEQTVADWVFTTEIELNRKLKKLFLRSEERGPSKKTYSSDEIFSNINGR